jgi:Arc/MetJ-type ribon-helix-helix transcriptional regulator
VIFLSKNKEKENSKNVMWTLVVPKTLDEAVENAVKRDMHISKSELIREAVKEKLERMGLGGLLKPKPIETQKRK